MKAHLPWLALALLLSTAAHAQEPTFMGAATHPGQAQFYARGLLTVEDSDDYMIHGRLVYGIISPLALQLDAHNEWLNEEDDYSSAIVRLKYRVIQKDFGPINTWRASIAGGIEYNSDNDPGTHLAAVTTAIINRHGLNGQIDWAHYDEQPDEYMLNAAHLFRISPARYTSTTKGAWYTELEWLNTIYEDGDYEMDLAPGLLYEARAWAAEVSLRLPITGNHPDQPNHTLAVGLRYLF